MEVKMIHKRKSLITLLTVLLVCFLLTGHAEALPATIHQDIERYDITSGVTLKKIKRFTDDGWLSINVLRIDLRNPYIKVDTLTNKESIQNLTSTKDLATQKGAVAAVNGSFFILQNEPGLVTPIGPIVESGEIKTAYNEFNSTGDSMATFALSKANEVFLDYWKTEILLITSSGDMAPVARYNRPYYGYTDLSIYDRNWSKMSPGINKYYNDVVEMVVQDGRVVDIRQGMPSVEIPEDGFVVTTRKEGAKIILSNFDIGDKVSFEITTKPDWTKLDMAVSGGAILIKNGKIPSKFSHDVSGRNPRTAIGSSANGKELFLVTVDGRQNASIGLTQYEMAELLIQLGVYNALNLDGGGSTAMTARMPGDASISLINTPSDGIVRRVANAVGVLSLAPPSELDVLLLSTTDRNVFVNTSKKIDIKGLDRYLNPISIGNKEIEWSVSGVKGRFEGNYFIPETAGEGIITAKIGKAKGQMTIKVLEGPVELYISRKSLNLPAGEKASFTVYGRDKKGFTAVIDPKDVNWDVYGGVGRVENGVFYAEKRGSGYIDAYIGNVHAYCGVSVPQHAVVLLDDFEKKNGTFLGYPETVTGNYYISDLHAKEGKYSGRLEYDFTKDPDKSRAAYLKFDGDGIPLHEDTIRLGLWVYSTHPSDNWLRAQVYDTEGNLHLLDFARRIDWSGWKYVEASISGFIPARLARIYAVQVEKVLDVGNLYFDNLTAVIYDNTPIDPEVVPDDTVATDYQMKSVVYEPTPDSFRFAVFGQSREPKNPLEQVLISRMSEKINKYIDAAILVGNKTNEINKLLEVPTVLSSGSGYECKDIKNARFIKLDMTGGSIRTAKKGQWQWFLDKLENFNGDHVFITADNLNFTDPLERNLFKKILSDYAQKTSKNVWVFLKGNTNEAQMEEGVKYITTAGFENGNITTENLDDARYVLVTIKGKEATFDIKPIV